MGHEMMHGAGQYRLLAGSLDYCRCRPIFAMQPQGALALAAGRALRQASPLLACRRPAPRPALALPITGGHHYFQAATHDMRFAMPRNIFMLTYDAAYACGIARYAAQADAHVYTPGASRFSTPRRR